MLALVIRNESATPVLFSEVDRDKDSASGVKIKKMLWVADYADMTGVYSPAQHGRLRYVHLTAQGNQ